MLIYITPIWRSHSPLAHSVGLLSLAQFSSGSGPTPARHCVRLILCPEENFYCPPSPCFSSHISLIQFISSSFFGALHSSLCHYCSTPDPSLASISQGVIMNTFSHVPPGFRFHPTDEELVDYYLRRKITNRSIDLDVIKDVDLYKIEPWDLQELCRIGTEDQNEWYFFSHKDKKYPTGTRTNRATAAGFWKATGRDKAIYSKHDLIGMRKTLVFYKGRAPNGQKSDWIMHEYRLETDENGTPQEEGWVVCRVFKKRIATTQKLSEHDSPVWYDEHVSFMPDMESPKHHSYNPNHLSYNNYPYKKEMPLQYAIPADHFLQLPLLESPKVVQQQQQPMSCRGLSFNNNHDHLDQNFHSVFRNTNDQTAEQVTDWRVLDKFVASQLSQEEVSKDNEAFPATGDLSKQEMAPENATTSSSTCQIDLWK